MGDDFLNKMSDYMISFYKRFIDPMVFKRQSSFELLRLYSSFIICLRHVLYFTFGGYHTHHDLYFLQSLTTISNNTFISMSAYFLVNSHFKLSRLIPVYIWTYYYSVGIYIYRLLNNKLIYNYDNFYYYLLPVTHSVFWFTGPFIFSQILYSLMAAGFKKTTFMGEFLIILIWFVLSCWGTLEHFNSVMDWGFGQNFIMFLFYYTIGNFIKNYKIRLNIILSGLGFLLTTWLHWKGILGEFSPYFKNYPIISKLLKSDLMYCPFATFQTVFLLLFTQEIPNIPYLSEIINFMGETSFGIYLYHCHPIVTGEMRLIDVRKYKKNPFWPCLNVTFGIWIRSMIVHMLNQLILNFCVFNAKWYQFVMNFLDKIFSLPEERPTAPPNDKDNEENLPDQNILADCKFEKVKINIDDLE